MLPKEFLIATVLEQLQERFARIVFIALTGDDEEIRSRCVAAKGRILKPLLTDGQDRRALATQCGLAKFARPGFPSLIFLFMPTPTRYEPLLPWKNQPVDEATPYRPDDRSGAVYLENEQLRFVAEIAIVTQRPLLLRGEPGSGKSSFAPFVARNLNWRYYEHTVTGRTEARDLLWRFDALRRLRDSGSGARGAEDLSPAKYVTPGPLWWAFNRAEALQAVQRARPDEAKAPAQSAEPFSALNEQRDPLRAVVLIDEISVDVESPAACCLDLGSDRHAAGVADAAGGELLLFTGSCRLAGKQRESGGGVHTGGDRGIATTLLGGGCALELGAGAVAGGGWRAWRLAGPEELGLDEILIGKPGGEQRFALLVRREVSGSLAAGLKHGELKAAVGV